MTVAARPRRTTHALLPAVALLAACASDRATRPVTHAPPLPVRASVAGATRPPESRSAMPAPVQGQPAWADVLDRVKLYGDFRLRIESDHNRDSGTDRLRERVRLRLGANYELADEILVGARIATGDPNDPNSTHVTLGEGFDDLDIALDRAFLTYTPSWLEGGFATVGKFAHPFRQNPVYGELVWDADIQPEGLVVGRTFPDLGRARAPKLVLGGYTLLEQSESNDSFILAGQASSGVQLGEQTSASAAVGYYYYSDVDALFDRNRGNAGVDTTGNGMADSFASDFGILHPILGLDHGGWGAPLRVGAEYIKNTRASVSEDQGWVVGASLGSSANKGDRRVYYQWQEIEQDAVFSPLAQDDFLLRTNFHGHVFGASWQPWDKMGLHLWTLVSARDVAVPGGGTQDQWRVRLDLNVKL